MDADDVLPVFTVCGHEMDLIGMMMSDGYVLYCQLDSRSGKEGCFSG